MAVQIPSEDLARISARRIASEDLARRIADRADALELANWRVRTATGIMLAIAREDQ